MKPEEEKVEEDRPIALTLTPDPEPLTLKAEEELPDELPDGMDLDEAEGEDDDKDDGDDGDDAGGEPDAMDVEVPPYRGSQP